MGEVQYLDEEIKKSGLKKSFLAKELGMSRQSFSYKCKNPTLFTAAQINVLCNLLKVTTLSKRDQIFFASKVE